MHLAGGSSAGYDNTAVDITLTATDNLSGVKTTYFSLDGATAIAYAAAVSVATPGSYTLVFYSVDVAGHTETSHTVTFKVTSPTTTVLTVTPNPAAAAGAAVTLTATVKDNLLGTDALTAEFAGETYYVTSTSAAVSEGVK